jgi:hypothetical protein
MHYFTLWDAPPSCAKTYDWCETQQTLLKKPAKVPYTIQGTVQAIPDLQALQALLDNAKPGTFLTQGVLRDAPVGQPVVSRRLKAAVPFDARPGLFCIDVDEADASLSMEAHVRRIRALHPCLHDVGFLAVSSSSSHLTTPKGTTGLKGLHLYGLIDTGEATPHVLEGLFNHALLAGKIRIKRSATKEGVTPAILLRGDVDLAFRNPHQPSFEGGAFLCSPRLSSTRESRLFEGGVLNAAALPMPDPVAVARARALLIHDVKPVSEDLFSAHAAPSALHAPAPVAPSAPLFTDTPPASPSVIARAVQHRVTASAPDEHRLRSERSQHALASPFPSQLGARHPVLALSNPQWLLYFDHLPTAVSVADVLHNPALFHEKTLKDPLLPERGPNKAIFYAHPVPAIFSHCHGGQRYLVSYGVSHYTPDRVVTDLSEALSTASKVVAVRAPMGVGKTRLLGGQIGADCHDNGKVWMALAHRRALVSELARVQDLIHDHSPEALHGLPEGMSFVCCLNSIAHQKHAPALAEVTTVFIDEWTSVHRALGELSQGTTTVAGGKKPHEVYRTLKTVLSRAQKVVVCDAFLTDASIEALSHLCDSPVEKVDHAQHRPCGAVQLKPGHGVAQTRAHALDTCQMSVMSGEKLWVAVSDIKTGEALHAHLSACFPNKKGQLLTSNEGKATLAHVCEDIEAHTQDLDWFIHTSVIHSGVSLTRTSFTRTVVVLAVPSLSVYDVAQMMRRVRTVRQFDVLLNTQMRSAFVPSLNEYQAWSGVLTALAWPTAPVFKTLSEPQKEAVVRQAYAQFCAPVLALADRQRAQMPAVLPGFLVQAGFSVSVIPAEKLPPPSVRGWSLPKVCAQVGAQRQQALNEARTAGPLAWQALQRTGPQTPQAVAQWQRTRQIVGLGLPDDETLTLDHERQWKEGKGVTPVLMQRVLRGEKALGTPIERAYRVIVPALFEGVDLISDTHLSPEKAARLIQNARRLGRLGVAYGVLPTRWARPDKVSQDAEGVMRKALAIVRHVGFVMTSLARPKGGVRPYFVDTAAMEKGVLAWSRRLSASFERVRSVFKHERALQDRYGLGRQGEVCIPSTVFARGRVLPEPMRVHPPTAEAVPWAA